MQNDIHTFRSYGACLNIESRGSINISPLTG